MDFLRNKAEHLAAHLREAIAHGEMHNPLPSLRQWSSALSVSTSTLQAALAILKHEGLLTSRPRSGYVLSQKRAKPQAAALVVRWIWHDPGHGGQPPSPEILTHLGQKLAAQGIGLRVERCDASRIRAVSRTGALPHELLVLSTLSLSQQRLFSKLGNAILAGLPHSGTPLPYVSSDVFPAIRHAALKLRRAGYDTIDLLNIVGRRLPESFQRTEQEYEAICQNTHPPIQGRTLWIPSAPEAQVQVFRRMIPKLSSRHGLIINAPVRPSLIMMVLAYHGIRIPEQVALLPVNILPSHVAVYPPISYYPFPVERVCSALARAAGHYFKTGRLPRLEQKIPLTFVEP